MVKKVIWISFLLLFSLACLYAANPRDIALNIQGSGSPNFVEGFKYALLVEAKAVGYQIKDELSAAKYGIKFTVEFDQTEQKSKFVVSLIKAADSSVITTMEYFFADEEEMLLYSQLVFFLLMSNLPEDVTAAEDTTWRDKWLYFNFSYDYSLMFLALKSDGLKGGIGAYNDAVDPPVINSLDNKITPMPFGLGIGIECQFLDFMSVEPHAQISMEEVLKDHIMYNALISLELKFPLKFFKSLVIAPYGAAAFSLRFPDDMEIFTNYPQIPNFIFGGGIHIAVKVGKSGAIFFDVNYMYVGDTAIKNYFGEYTPKPEEIHYDNSILGFRIGYKIGLFDRKK